jgi:hypothetical protein
MIMLRRIFMQNILATRLRLILKLELLQLVIEWAEFHELELIENWSRAENKKSLLNIEPLE